MRLRRLVLATGIAVGSVITPAVASAQTDPYVSRPPEVSGIDEGRPTEVAGVEVERAAPAVAGQGETLPVTGGDVVGLTVIGVAAIGAGTVLVRRARRAPSPA